MELYTPSRIRNMPPDEPNHDLLTDMLACLEGPGSQKCPFVGPGLGADAIFLGIEPTAKPEELEDALMRLLPDFIARGPCTDGFKAVVVGLPNFDNLDALPVVCRRASQRGYGQEKLVMGTFMMMVRRLDGQVSTGPNRKLWTIVIRPYISTDANPMASRQRALGDLIELAAQLDAAEFQKILGLLGIDVEE